MRKACSRELLLLALVLTLGCEGTKFQPYLGPYDCGVGSAPPELEIQLLRPYVASEVASDGATVVAGPSCSNGNPIIWIQGVAQRRHADGGVMTLTVTRVNDRRLIASREGVDSTSCKPQFAVFPPLDADLADDALDGTAIVIEYRVSLPGGVMASTTVAGTIHWVPDLCSAPPGS